MMVGPLFSQLQQDFNDSDLSAWSGDIDKFIINEDFRLQLLDDDAGTALIYTETTYQDSILWAMDIALDFAPSGSNRLEIWLGLNDTDISNGSGYIIEIGETGADDAFRLLEIIDGNSSIIAEGIMGNVSSEFDHSLELSFDSENTWTLRSKSVTDIAFIQEFEIEYEPLIDFNTLRFFGFNCTYTSTRIDQFFFDNITIDELQADETAPLITDVEIITANQIEITFDEELDSNTAISTDNYMLDPFISIASVELDEDLPFIITLLLNDPLPSGQLIELNIQNVSDIAGNIIQPSNFELSLTEQPTIGDLLLNEILFDPFTNGEDFVEIVNVSEKFLNLNGLIIENNTNSQSSTIQEDLILFPSEIIALSEDISFLESTYNPIDEAILYEQDLPAFNNDDGNVSLITNDGSNDIILDSYDYDEDDHLSLISDTEGISLERISLSAVTNDPNNWSSASESTNFATPGYQNSSELTSTPNTDDIISLADKVFSPDSDGNKDVLIINYNLEKPGFIANVTIHHDRGRSEVSIADNQLLSTNGFLRWDGTNEDGVLSPVGIYIIAYELFHSDGDIIKGREVCVLAQRLD